MIIIRIMSCKKTIEEKAYTNNSVARKISYPAFAYSLSLILISLEGRFFCSSVNKYLVQKG